ncbi:hypothetical protein ILYODFUR_037095 [Ilyodon furcidens]|uniref:Uncharacterized protein n=1 Tax=Ilyodon furcidens TaxID=33524 RepID=A0ABV0TE65_9TELE
MTRCTAAQRCWYCAILECKGRWCVNWCKLSSMDQGQATVPEHEDQSKAQRKRSEPEPGPEPEAEPEPRLISKRRSEIPSVENEEWGRFLKLKERSLQVSPENIFPEVLRISQDGSG